MTDSHTYVVKKTCPICGEMSRVIKVKSRLIVEKTDWDFCTHYRDFDPYYYTIWVCEHCGYAADENTFLSYIPEKHKSKIGEFLVQHKVGFKFQPERGLPEAVAAYKLAIYYAEMIEESLAHRAGLYLKLAWVYRTGGKDDEEKAMERPYLKKAAELYTESVMRERYPIGPMTDSMALYISGACYYLMGDLEQATQTLSRLISDLDLRDVDPKLYDRVRDLWQDIREARK